MAEVWDETTFGKYYYGPVSGGTDNDFRAGFTREFFRLCWEGEEPDGTLTWFNRRRDALISQYGITPADRILIGGAALGFLIQSFHAAGYTNCWGIDDSPLITQGHPDVVDGVILISERVQPGGRIKNILRQQTGDDVFDFIITEDVLPCMTDAEILSEQILTACDAIKTDANSKVIHIVTEKQNDLQHARHPLINWKYMQEWRDFLDTNGFTGHFVCDAPMRQFL